MFNSNFISCCLILGIFSETVADETNSTVQQWKEISWGAKEFNMHPHYITFYNNVARNLITAVIPLVSLGFLNYLVYKHLKERRKMVSRLGRFLLISQKYLLIIFENIIPRKQIRIK